MQICKAPSSVKGIVDLIKDRVSRAYGGVYMRNGEVFAMSLGSVTQVITVTITITTITLTITTTSLPPSTSPPPSPSPYHYYFC